MARNDVEAVAEARPWNAINIRELKIDEVPHKV